MYATNTHKTYNVQKTTINIAQNTKCTHVQICRFFFETFSISPLRFYLPYNINYVLCAVETCTHGFCFAQGKHLFILKCVVFLLLLFSFSEHLSTGNKNKKEAPKLMLLEKNIYKKKSSQNVLARGAAGGVHRSEQ